MEAIYNLPYYLGGTGPLLSGVPEVDWNILMQLKGADLLMACEADQYTQEICDTPAFWIRKITHDYNANVASETLPEGMTYKDYYLILSLEGPYIPQYHPESRRLWKFARDDDFWRKKVINEFGQRIAELNRDTHSDRLGGVYQVQYYKLWGWKLGKIGDEDYVPIDEETLLNFFQDFTLDYNDLDVMYWLMTDESYRKYMLLHLKYMLSEYDTLEDRLGAVPNFYDLVMFLHGEGFLTTTNNHTILKEYAKMASRDDSDIPFQNMLGTDILKDQDILREVIAILSNDNNIGRLYALYRFGHPLDVDLIKSIMSEDDIISKVFLFEEAKFVHNILGVSLSSEILNNILISETNLHVIQEMINIGAQPDDRTLPTAIENNNGRPILDYLLEIGAPTEKIRPIYVDTVHLERETVSWLRSNGFGGRFKTQSGEDLLSKRIISLS